MLIRGKHTILMDQAGATGADTLAGGGGGGATGADTLAGGGSGGTGAAAAWYDGFKDPVAKEWLKSYNGAYPDAESVALKALNLEKFLGAEKAGRGVIIPKSDAKPEEWKAFYSKIGRAPEKPEGYKIPEGMKADDPVLREFQSLAHKMGMPADHWTETMSWYTGLAKKTQDRQLAEFEAKGERELSELRTEWGNAYDRKAELGQRAAAAFVPASTPEQRTELLTRIEGAIGTKATLQLFANIGEQLGEHGFVDGEGTVTGGGVTPEAARVRIEQLKGDREWGKGLINGDADKRAEWDRLHQVAYGKKAT